MATIAENLQTIQNIKQDIKTAIENKGVDMTNTPFSEYSTKIDGISAGGGIDINEYGIKLGYSSIQKIPDGIDFSNVTDMSYMFSDCYYLQSVSSINTSKATNMNSMFYNCERLENLALIDTSKVVDMGGMLGNTMLKTIPQFDTRSAENVNSIFHQCIALKTIPLLDFGSVTSIHSIFGIFELDLLTSIGGFKNLKKSVTREFIDLLPNLSTSSLINIINNLYDWSGNTDGYAPLNNGTMYNFGTTHSLKFGENLSKLSDAQIAVATAKGWTLTY